MTVAETLAGIKKKFGYEPSADYRGTEDANDFIFAIQTDKTTQTQKSQTQKSQWIVAAERVKEHSGSLNASTEDVNFIRASATTKGTTQRTFSINGNRCVGDAFQDFLLSHKIVFGSGSDVVVPYIYFSARTGKGEVGECVLIVTSDVGGSAGAAATFACDAKGIETPEEFDYLKEENSTSLVGDAVVGSATVGV